MTLKRLEQIVAGGRILANHICELLVSTSDVLLDPGMIRDCIFYFVQFVEHLRMLDTGIRKPCSFFRNGSGGSVSAWLELGHASQLANEYRGG